MTDLAAPRQHQVRPLDPRPEVRRRFGAIYLLVGAAGFAMTGFSDFAGMDHHKLVIFAVNPLHNVIHLVLGLAWLAAAPRHRCAPGGQPRRRRRPGLVTVLGFVGGMGMLGMSGLADPDNFLHLATATLALYFGSAAAESQAQRDEDRADEPVLG